MLSVVAACILQAPLVSVVLTLLFVVGGRHIVPHWPSGEGRDLVEHCVVALHAGLIAYAGRVFLVSSIRPAEAVAVR